MVSDEREPSRTQRRERQWRRGAGGSPSAFQEELDGLADLARYGKVGSVARSELEQRDGGVEGGELRRQLLVRSAMWK